MKAPLLLIALTGLLLSGCGQSAEVDELRAEIANIQSEMTASTAPTPQPKPTPTEDEFERAEILALYWDDIEAQFAEFARLHDRVTVAHSPIIDADERWDGTDEAAEESLIGRDLHIYQARQEFVHIKSVLLIPPDFLSDFPRLPHLKRLRDAFDDVRKYWTFGAAIARDFYDRVGSPDRPAPQRSGPTQWFSWYNEHRALEAAAEVEFEEAYHELRLFLGQ